MHKKKSPGRHQGKKREGNKESLPSSYLAAADSVNPECYFCHYFREADSGRWKRIFCALTGEAVTETWYCEFWTPIGGAA